jgi:hypothetical protein
LIVGDALASGYGAVVSFEVAVSKKLRCDRRHTEAVYGCISLTLLAGYLESLLCEEEQRIYTAICDSLLTGSVWRGD